MSNDIRIKKGLDIKLKGKAEKATEKAIVSNFYTIRPEDFHGVIPKLIAKEGSRLKAGEPGCDSIRLPSISRGKRPKYLCASSDIFSALIIVFSNVSRVSPGRPIT